MDDQMRLSAVMRLLGGDRRLLRFRGGEVPRGFVRGDLCARSVHLSARSAAGHVRWTLPDAMAAGLNQH
jgi:hypothetical protein